MRGKTIGIDATTLEASAAMRSLVRRDTGQGYETVVKGLANSSGVPTPTRKVLVRFDRKRKAMTYARMAGGGTSLGEGDSGVVASGGRDGRCGGRPVRGGEPGGRDSEGIAPSAESSGGDSGGEGAFGGGATGRGRRSGTVTGTRSESEGRAAVQTGLWGSGPEGAEQLHGSREPDHEDEPGRVLAELQRAGDGGGSKSVDRGDGGDGERE